MPYKKGESGNPDGKPKGVKNKLTTSVKEAFKIAFDELQGDDQHKLSEWAKSNPTEFYKLASKLIPTEIKGEDGKELIKIVIESGKGNQG